MYNTFSTLLRESPLIQVVAYLLYVSIILHTIYAAIVTYQNRSTRPERYAMNNTLENSSWTSQNMGFLGLLILIFIVVHLANFWMRIKLNLGEGVGKDSMGNLDVYEVTYHLFQNPYYVIFYAVLALPLGLHLHHGLQSAFKTLGFYHNSGLQVLSKASLIYAWVMSIGFGIIPIIVYFK
jgi:succinate dehydrogenase / fumarate reductase cytochrome b subunit